MYYQPRRTLGLLVGAVLASWSAAIGVLLVNAGLTAGTGLAQLAAYGGGALAATLALLFCYWCYGLATLAYRVDRNGLVIEFGTTRQVIPLDAIERLVPERSLGAVPRVRGISPPRRPLARPHPAPPPAALRYSPAPPSTASGRCSSTPRTSRRSSCST